MNTVEEQMQELALERFGTEDLSELSGGQLEVLEKEVTGNGSMG